MLRVRVHEDFRRLDQIDRTIGPNTQRKTEQVVNLIVKDIHESWSPVSPSPWGQAPAVVSGDLDRSVNREPTPRDPRGRFTSERDGAFYVIRVDEEYAGVLENDPRYNRPFLEPALERAAAIFPIAYRDII